jgi:hypothetical protein
MSNYNDEYCVKLNFILDHFVIQNSSITTPRILLDDPISIRLLLRLNNCDPYFIEHGLHFHQKITPPPPELPHVTFYSTSWSGIFSLQSRDSPILIDKIIELDVFNELDGSGELNSDINLSIRNTYGTLFIELEILTPDLRNQ